MCFVSLAVLEEYTVHRTSATWSVTYITYVAYCTYCTVMAVWLDKCDSKMIYKRSMQSQALYVVPITSILGRLALVPVGYNGTMTPSYFPCAMTNPTIVEQFATQRRVQVMVIDGGTAQKWATIH